MHHQTASALLTENSEEPSAPVEAVAVSGAAVEGVPRLDRWLQAAALVDRSDSCSDFTSGVSVSAVGSVLEQGSCKVDASRKTAGRMIFIMGEPLRWRTVECMRRATVSSLAIDERDTVMLVYARIYMAECNEVYNTFLGCLREYGSGPENCRDALVQVVKRACTFQLTRDTKATVFCKDAFKRLCKSVRSAVADGGPTEQKALFEMSPGAKEECNRTVRSFHT